jgi:periplasmic protein CpxP/Spy
MKKYGMLVMALAFMFALSATAQDQMPPKGERGPKKEFRRGDKPRPTAEMRVDRMAKQLSLTNAEKAKVKALFESQDAKHEKKQAEMKKMREEMKVKFEAERKAQDDELQKIIGAEKFQKLQATRAERFEKMKHRGEHAPKHAPEPPVAK